MNTDFAHEHYTVKQTGCQTTLMTLEDTARFLRVRRRALRRAIRRGQIPTIPHGDQVFVSRRRLLSLLATPNGPSIGDPQEGRR